GRGGARHEHRSQGGSCQEFELHIQSPLVALNAAAIRPSFSYNKADTRRKCHRSHTATAISSPAIPVRRRYTTFAQGINGASQDDRSRAQKTDAPRAAANAGFAPERLPTRQSRRACSPGNVRRSCWNDL